MDIFKSICGIYLFIYLICIVNAYVSLGGWVYILRVPKCWVPLKLESWTVVSHLK